MNGVILRVGRRDETAIILAVALIWFEGEGRRGCPLLIISSEGVKWKNNSLNHSCEKKKIKTFLQGPNFKH